MRNWRNFATSLWCPPSDSDTNCKSGKSQPSGRDCYSTCQIGLFGGNINCEQSDTKGDENGNQYELSRPTKMSKIKQQGSFVLVATCAAI